ncbi:MAG: NHLP bacteriocin export ABC transporter permease/ATPase subunit [Candidatus Poribacteria bacterium]|nr:NHLP bacteriocin export ABC transporter permease/ATPase subunit [Candidatus Poribacteria bacterium]
MLPYILENEGILIEAEGNTPFFLDDSNDIWFVQSGKVDIFAVEVQSGKRRHLFRAEPNEALFGMESDASENGMRLLAVGMMGTHLLKVPRSRLRAEVATLIDKWVAGLSSGIARDIPPKQYEQLEPNKETVLAAGVNAIVNEDILWVKHIEGSSRFMGREELPLSAEDGFIPISAQTWLESVNESKLSSVETEAFMNQDSSWTGLERFHRLVLDWAISDTEQATKAEHQRLQDKADSDRSVFENAVSQLASVLETGRSRVRIPAEEDALLAASQLVGNALGITVKPHPDSRKGHKQRDALANIAKVSRFRLRRTILKEDWWRTDNGPLLAYIEAETQPVALLPTSPRSYELCDPVKRTRTPVTPEVAASLAPFAYTFYPPFPDRALAAFDLLKFGVQSCKADLFTIILMGIGAGILGTITPILTGILFDTTIPGGQRNQLLQLTLALLASAFATALFQVTQSIATLRVEGKMDSSIQAAVWIRLLSLPASFFRDYTAGDLANRGMGIHTIRQILTGATLSSILGGVFSIFSFGLLFYYDLRLALVATVLVGITLFATILASYFQLRYQRILYDVQGRISGTVLQFITGISKLRVAGAEIRAFAVWAKEFSQQKHLALKARTVENGLTVFNAALPIVTSVVFFSVIAFSANVTLSTGIFLAFNAAFGQFLFAALAMSSAFIATLEIAPIFQRAKPIFSALPEADAAQADPGELSGKLELNHASFRYKPDVPLALDDVSLSINPGEFVAIVGPSGSGKSTLFRLLLGFETPETGSIYYDGMDAAKLDSQAVRNQIGVVLQNGKLIPGDFFTNIVGSSELTLDDAWEAARLVGLDEDIKRMPMGMHTVISEGGGTFSGGQRQRLMIARAIVKKPRILLFDEATSALDNRTQEVVSKSLENLRATRIVIAHRLSTIRNADRIYVFDSGKVVQSGTYDELVNQQGIFENLVKRQIL